jgi:cyanophycinase-like exopeptidase
VANGVFDTADFVWSSVSGDQSEAVILWDDTQTNDRLIAFYDTGITGMPVTPNGGNINVTVNASGWFSL